MSEKSQKISRSFLKVDIVVITLMQIAYSCPFLITLFYIDIDERSDSTDEDVK